MKSITRMAERYFDEEIAPMLRASGTPEYPIKRLRDRYIRDIHDNPTAIEQLQERYT